MTPSGPHDDSDVLSSSDAEAPRGRSRRGLVAGLMAAALVAAGATGVALAADKGSPSPSAAGTTVNGTESPGSTATRLPKDKQDRPGRRFGRGGGFGGPMGALHGEFVVPKQGGGYQTVLVQHGTVSVVSSTSITVKSADGYVASYSVAADTVVNATRDGISSIAKGAEVNVLAQKTSGKAKALRIGDRSRWGGMAHGPGDGPGGDNDGTPPTPGNGATTGSSAFGV
ncbi:MAG: hypothetical protein ACXV3C_07395 [Actinomycetes bacterium]